MAKKDIPAPYDADETAASPKLMQRLVRTLRGEVSGAARYPVGPSTGRSNGGVSAPGVAEARGHQGVPAEEQPGEAASPPRAAEEAALHRVARRRRRKDVQRRERVDVRYSVEEKRAILAKARSLNIAGAHLVGAAVLAYLDGELALPGQRTPVDDLIDELNALRGQVARVGNNVNQIARVLNSDASPHAGDAEILAQAERTLEAVRAAVGDIAAATNRAVSTEVA